MIFERIAREVTLKFHELSGKTVHIHLACADQLTFEEFIRSCRTPSQLINGQLMNLPLTFQTDPEIYHGLTGNLKLVEKKKLKDFNTDEYTTVKAPESRELTEEEAAYMKDYITPLSSIIKRFLKPTLNRN